MGYWRDLVYDETVVTNQPYFSLPEDSESLLGVTIDDSTTNIRSLWHDYRIGGSGSLTRGNGPDPLYGVVDDGYAPTVVDLDRTDEYTLYVRPMKEGDNLPDCGRVIVTFLNSSGDLDEEIFQMDESTGLVGAKTDASRITSVVFDQVAFTVKVIAVKTTDVPTIDLSSGSDDWTNGLILTLARGEGNDVPRYRRYRLSNPSKLNKIIRLLLKRKFRPLRHINDIVHLGNLNVLKHGLLGLLAEDNSDIERANYHWGTCRLLLEEEMDAHRGSARPTVKFNPVGEGARTVPNLM